MPIALEKFGPVGIKALPLAGVRALSQSATEDLRESVFLFQRFSVAIKQFKALCSADTFEE